jgi:hypothetical protein
MMTSFASDPCGGWAAGMDWGLVYAAGDLSTERSEPFGCGFAWSVAGSPSGRVAVATYDGEVRLFDLDHSSFRRVGHYPHPSAFLQLSNDGSQLLSSAWSDYRAESDLSIRALSLPSGALLRQWEYTLPTPWAVDAALAPNGSVSARRVCARTEDGLECTLQLGDLAGAFDAQLALPPSFEMATPAAEFLVMRFSPNGELLAVPGHGPHDRPMSAIYRGSALAVLLEGTVAGWFDDEHVFLKRYNWIRQDAFVYADTVVADLQGETLHGPFVIPSVPELRAMDDQYFYARQLNTIYSLADGTVHWSDPTGRLGDVAGSWVVYPSDWHFVPNSNHLVRFHAWQ